MAKKKTRKAKELEPTGIGEIDRLEALDECAIEDYVGAVSAYVRQSSDLPDGPKKAAQIRMSNALARALQTDLIKELPKIRLHVGEKKVSGALRTVNADVSEMHELDGLRLAVELKPVNLAVGRAIWNRFGDLRTFAVNLHLKFPFAVVGGVLVIPTYEQRGTKEWVEAEIAEEHADGSVAEGGNTYESVADRDIIYADVENLAPPGLLELDEEVRPKEFTLPPNTKSTRHLIERAVQRLVRAGGRETEGDAPHLLEAISVVVYDPMTNSLDPSLPSKESKLRWEDFVQMLATAYKGRFED